jgi:hypothetical protein
MRLIDSRWLAKVVYRESERGKEKEKEHNVSEQVRRDRHSDVTNADATTHPRVSK